MYIRVDENCSGAVQEALFEMGVSWSSGGRTVKNTHHPILLVATGTPRGVPTLFIGSLGTPADCALDLRGTRSV